MSTFPQVAQNIRLARKARAHTQASLARKLKVTERTVRSWENGHFCPSGEHLDRLARVLKRDPAWFYGLDDERIAA